MANPTTNYSFVLPTSSDLVTDLPADFDVALQGVDTRLKALQPGTTLGDLAYSSATANTNTRLGIGTNGQVLAVSGGVPAWTTTSDVTPLTTKGDLFTFTTVDARLGIGANDTVLTADSAEATGMKWATPAAGGQTTIATGSLSGSTVTISSIPQTYKDLRLYVYNWSSTTGDGNMFLKINNTTANTFARMLGSTPDDDSTGTGGGGLRFSGGIVSSSVATNMGVIEFIDYARTDAFKAFTAVYGSTNVTTFQSFEGGGVFKTNTAISSIVLDPESTQTFDNGSYVLIGIN